jgi:hypothetical protein
VFGISSSAHQKALHEKKSGQINTEDTATQWAAVADFGVSRHTHCADAVSAMFAAKYNPRPVLPLL